MATTHAQKLRALIEQIDPVQYARTRNFGDGSVTNLGPYISRGFSSTKVVFEHVLSLALPWSAIEKMVQELAWRDYWQQVWIHKSDAIFSDLKHPQKGVMYKGVPKALSEAQTGIEAVDRALNEFKTTGRMHNHMRMYIASIACNIGQYHWSQPAQWMYAHLLDGDIASNHLSWQWVAGSNANKKYIANQANINKYFASNQTGSYLDCAYEDILGQPIPEALQLHGTFDLKTKLPDLPKPKLKSKDTLVYNYYNLDPNWHVDQDFQRVLLLEPSIFEQYPVAEHCIDFMLELAKEIPHLVIYVGSFEELNNSLNGARIRYKEHPLNQHYTGEVESRDWMTSVTGYYPSFFGFWKKVKKALKAQSSQLELLL